MANVVIAYTGNVCSTPMIEYARLTKGIFVPVREHFDQYLFSKFSGDDDRICADLAHEISAVFTRKSSPFLEQEKLLAYRDGGPIPTLLEKPHALFKWRCYDPGLPESVRISEVFRENEAVPVIMLRSSLIEQAVKVFLSETVYGGRHQQFKTGEMTPQEYEAYVEEQSRVQVVVSEEDLDRIQQIARNFLQRSLRMIENVRYFFPHVAEPRLIVAEDIFRPLIDYRQYNFALKAMFGDVDEVNEQGAPAVRKGGLELSHCANLDMVVENAALGKMESRYRAAAAGLDNIFGSD